MVNGPDGWSIASIMPGSNGRAIVILRKQAPYVLPDPKPLNKMEEVEAPRDQELQATEEAALAFAAEEGLTPPPVVEDDGTGEAVLEAGEDNEAALHAAEEFARRALPRGAVEVEEGTGALPARDSQLISRAIDINRAETLPPPVPTGIQPDAFPPDQGQQGERFVGAAGIENIRAGMRNLLDTDALPNA
jgi:hypothetical protein